jgi:hypothetical protein
MKQKINRSGGCMNAKGWQRVVWMLVIALGCSTAALAQNNQNQNNQNRGGFNQNNQGGFGGRGNFQGQGGQQNFDPAELQRQVRQSRADAIKEALAATDEEWAVLGPRIEKINGLNADANTGISGMMSIFGRRGGLGGGRGGGGGARGGAFGGLNIQTLMGGSNAMAQKMADLAAAVDNPAMPESEIKSRLAAVRAERERVRAELAKERADLVQFLTQRQEAILFQMGVLD